ncbi:dephospho-CoA kinase [Eionea flava]
MTFILGVTGGIASGKTSATKAFQSLGINVVDADIVARELVSLGSPALSTISQHFGKSILLDSGELNRQQLREIIFSQPEEKTWLESTLHPLIREAIQQQLLSITSPYGILSSPLLFETQQNTLTHRTLAIDCPTALQIKRASQRDSVEHSQIERIIQTQLSRTERNQCADDIIINDGNLEQLTKNIEDYHNKLLTAINR